MMDTSAYPIEVTCVLIDADGKEVARDRTEIPGSAGLKEAAGWIRIPMTKALTISWERCRADWIRRVPAAALPAP